MKKQLITTNHLPELTFDECNRITGGGDIKSTVKCIVYALAGKGGGGGGMRTFLLGPTLWGLARVVGVVVGCANL